MPECICGDSIENHRLDEDGERTVCMNPRCHCEFYTEAEGFGMPDPDIAAKDDARRDAGGWEVID